MNAKDLKEKLFYTSANAASNITDEMSKEITDFCEDYKNYMNVSKTERQAVKSSIKLLEENGFKEFEKNKKYQAGDKIYKNHRNKSLIAAVIGTEGLENGAKFAASHIDSPRLDLKPRPIYEKDELAFFKTHYYGGVKKYQWTAIPLALTGVVIDKNGKAIDITIGEDENDPIFYITDLLPHLAKDQVKKPLSQGISGEELNILVGSLPFKDDKESDLVKLNLLNILNEKYGITERDFISAELTAVPAYKAKDVGFDRSMIAAYGHDDKICAYTSLMAAIEVKNPKYTTITVLADKEETGSNSNTGLDTNFLLYFVNELALSAGVEPHRVLENSTCLSADVNAAHDPTFPDVLEINNAAKINHGVALTKYTGSGGKYSTSDANAEFVGYVTNLLDRDKVFWQIAELGKVDQGGGGTVAMFLSALDIEVIDVGVPVLAMHAPYELVSKIDTFMTYKAFYSFFNDEKMV